MIQVKTLKKYQVVKSGHDIYRVIDGTPVFDCDGENPCFLAQRFIKTKEEYSKSPTSLRFSGNVTL